MHSENQSSPKSTLIWTSLAETDETAETRSNEDRTLEVLIFYSSEDRTVFLKVLLDLASEIISNNILIYPDRKTIQQSTLYSLISSFRMSSPLLIFSAGFLAFSIFLLSLEMSS